MLFDAEELDYYMYTTRAWIDVVCALSVDKMPLAEDLERIAAPISDACACTRDPLWRHDLYGGHDDDKSEQGDLFCTQGEVERLAPLRRWIRPRPLSMATIFPGWTPSAPESDTRRQEFIDWLAERHLIDEQAEPTPE